MKMKKILVVLFCMAFLTVGLSAQDKSKEKNTSESTLAGGWTSYSFNISPEARKVFDMVLPPRPGVTYTPLAVATQVVAGMNYSFFCNRQIVYPSAPNEAVIVLIYVPLYKSPQLISIIPISRKEKNNLEANLKPGGWTPYRSDISPEAKTKFDTALNGLSGVTYIPVAVATQVVAGINYSFFCNAKVVYPNAPNEAAMILIYAPLDKPPYIISITPVEH